MNEKQKNNPKEREEPGKIKSCVAKHSIGRYSFCNSF